MQEDKGSVIRRRAQACVLLLFGQGARLKTSRPKTVDIQKVKNGVSKERKKDVALGRGFQGVRTREGLTPVKSSRNPVKGSWMGGRKTCARNHLPKPLSEREEDAVPKLSQADSGQSPSHQEELVSGSLDEKVHFMQVLRRLGRHQLPWLPAGL